MKIQKEILISLFNALIPWYIKFLRNLPWRSNPLPYHVWLSEIVFQQTRIEQGLPYFNNILDRFPNINSLADAPEDELLSLWQGLGYYSRALNLHKAAKQIVLEFDGQFPSEFADIRSLPGVGTYTSAAIASIAFEKPVAVFDGNVRRIMGRIFCIDDPVPKLITTELDKIIQQYKPSVFNQSMMELGALVCKPKSPDCLNCPVINYCCAYKKDKVSKYPVPQKRTVKSKLHFAFIKIVTSEMPNKFALVKRNSSGIWRGLYEFPSVELTDENTAIDKEFQRLFPKVKLMSNPIFLNRKKHELTHKTIRADFYELRCSGVFPKNWEWHNEASASKKGMHKLMFEFFK